MTEGPGGLDQPERPDEGLDGLDHPSQPTSAELPPRRLSPLTPLVRGAVLVVAVAVTSADEVLSGEVGPLGFLLIAVLLGGFAFGFASWLRTRYWIQDDELRIDKGVVYHQSRRIRIDRLQGIDIVQPFVARLFGLAELKMDTAGGDREGSLAYLPLAEAQEVRQVLLARRDEVRRPAAPPVAPGQAAETGESGTAGPSLPPGVDPRWAAPEVELARLDLGTLVLSLLLSLETIGVVVGTLLFGGLALIATGALITPVVPLLIGFALVQVRRLSAYYDFTVSQTSAGLQVRRGLFEKNTQTIALARVQGVLVSEPVLWRQLGWARLDVAIAGYGSDSDSDGGPSATTVMPVAPRPLVMRLARHLLAGDPSGVGPGGLDVDPDSVQFTAPPRSARWVDPFARRFMGAGVSEGLVASRQGWFTRRTHAVRHARVQSLRLHQGPLQRLLGLADLHADSPPGPVHVLARHRDPAEARALLEREQELAELARRGPRDQGGRQVAGEMGGVVRSRDTDDTADGHW